MRKPQHMFKFFGWRLALAGASIHAIHSGLFMQAFGSYSVLLQREFGWTATTLSIAFAFTRMESGLLGPIQGWLLDRHGPRPIMMIGTIIFALGFFLFATMNSLTEFFIFYFLMALGSSLGGFLSITTALVNWFDKYRSSALAISQAGFAAGALFLPLLVYVLENYGWREASISSGVIILIIGLPVSLMMRHRPSDSGDFVDGINPKISSSKEQLFVQDSKQNNDFTAKQALRTRAFWMISAGHAASLLVVGSVMLHLPLHLTSPAIGMSLQKASFIVGAVPAMQIFGQFFGGFLGDRYDKKLILILCMLGHMSGLLLVTYPYFSLMIWGFVPVHGIAWGARGPIIQSIRADYFGPTNFGTIMGFSSMVVMIGMVLGPLVAGILADYTGSYTLGFTILAIAAGIGSVFFLLATPPKNPQVLV